MKVSELSIALAIVRQAVDDLTLLKGNRCDRRYRDTAQELGYAGITDELTTYFHGRDFAELCIALDIEPDSLLKQLGLTKQGCLCASCTGTDAVMVEPPGLFEDVVQAIERGIQVGRGTIYREHIDAAGRKERVTGRATHLRTG